jgi:hypothetical protein
MRPGQWVRTPKGLGRLLTRIRPDKWWVLFGKTAFAFTDTEIEVVQGERTTELTDTVGP